MRPTHVSGCASAALLCLLLCAQACGSSRHPTTNPSPAPISCTTIGILPCYRLQVTPLIANANIALTYPNGSTSATSWALGQGPTVNGCPQTDPNGPYLALSASGRYQVTVDANAFNPTTLSFTMADASCGNGECAYACLVSSPSPLAMTLTAAP